ncbi:transposase [Anthocerotibacter panamensis]
MKNKLVELFDKELLRHQRVIESVNDQLKNLCQIDHSGPPSTFSYQIV